MTTIDIERLLRQPAHDEPVILPALVLPRVTATGGLRDRSMDTPLGFGRGSLTMRVAIAALLLAAALVGALVSGAIRLEQLSAPFARDGAYEGRGITLAYPPSWARITPPVSGDDFSSVALIASSTGVDGCSAEQVGTLTPEPPVQSLGSDGVYYADADDQYGKIYGLADRIYACMIEKPMRSGEIRVVLTQNAPQRIQIGPIGDFKEPFYDSQSAGGWSSVVPGEAVGFTEELGGMPALLAVRDSVIPGADEVRTWVIAGPDYAGSMWHVQAVIAGPDLPRLREEADAVARSFAFDSLPEPLDPAMGDVALAKVLNEMDRQSRRYPGTRLMGCFPRTPGEATVTVTDGPNGRLREPAEVTCKTTLEATDVRLWRATFSIEWPARDGAAAGRWGRETFFNPDGIGGSEGQLYPDEGAATFPGSWFEPLPAGPAPALVPGSLVRVIGSWLQTGMLNQAFTPGGPSDAANIIDGAPGTLLMVVDGPVTDDGLDWYRFDKGETELGWAVPWADGRPLVEVAEPACPTVDPPTVEDVVYLSELIRWLCYGDRELTFGPSQYVARDDVSGEVPHGEPAWLAVVLPDWALFGSGGANGVDAGMPAVLAPGVDKPGPRDWVTVRGHFNDPAAATCTWTYPEDWSMEKLPPAEQQRRCAQRFVITSIEPVDAP